MVFGGGDVNDFKFLEDLISFWLMRIDVFNCYYISFKFDVLVVYFRVNIYLVIEVVSDSLWLFRDLLKGKNLRRKFMVYICFRLIGF